MGVELDFFGVYFGWKFDVDFEIMYIFCDMYEGIYGYKLNIMVIYVGFECGLFKKFYLNMDMVFFGLIIKFLYLLDEKVKIDMVDLFW